MTARKQTISDELFRLMGRIKKAEEAADIGAMHNTTTLPLEDEDNKDREIPPDGSATKDNDAVLAELGPAFFNNKKANSVPGDLPEIGVKNSPSGESPETETESTEKKYPDPGTDHPASADDPEVNTKYSFDENTPFEKLAAAYHVLAESVIDQTAALFGANLRMNTKRASAATAGTQGVLTHQDKQAIDQLIFNNIQETIKYAHDRATDVAEVYDNFYAMQKVAEMADIVQQQEAEMTNKPEEPAAPPPSAGGGDLDPRILEALNAFGPTIDENEKPQAMEMLQQLGVSPEEIEQILQQLAAEEAAGAGLNPAEAGAMGAAPPPIDPAMLSAMAQGAEGGAPMPPPPDGMQVQAYDKYANYTNQESLNRILELIQRSKL